jgi:hypothetical protein
VPAKLRAAILTPVLLRLNCRFGGGIPNASYPKLQAIIASEGMRYLFKFCSAQQTGPDTNE